jgi:hypothetical protein
VHGEIVVHGSVDEVEELAKLDGVMWRTGLVDDLAGGDVQRDEHFGDLVALVVMGSSFDLSRAHRQGPLGAVESLKLPVSHRLSPNA